MYLPRYLLGYISAECTYISFPYLIHMLGWKLLHITATIRCCLSSQLKSSGPCLYTRTSSWPNISSPTNTSRRQQDQGIPLDSIHRIQICQQHNYNPPHLPWASFSTSSCIDRFKQRPSIQFATATDHECELPLRDCDYDYARFPSR